MSTQRTVEEIYEDVLGRLRGVKPHGDYSMAFCPVHNNTGTPALSVKKHDDGVGLDCKSQSCSTESICAAIGIKQKDLFVDSHQAGAKVINIGDRAKAREETAKEKGLGCTLAEYAEAKELPVEFLQSLGCRDQKPYGFPAVRIPYHSPEGEEQSVRFRTALEKSKEGQDERFRWRKGSKAMLYGLEQLEKIKDVDQEQSNVILVEGESDQQTLRYHGFPALGIPGTKTWQSEWAEHLDGIEKIYIFKEPDEAGADLITSLANSAIKDRLYVVDIGKTPFKDVSEMHVNPDDVTNEEEGFTEYFKQLLAGARHYLEIEAEEQDKEKLEAWAECGELANQEDILDVFGKAMVEAGVAGETKIAEIIYLAVTSRMLKRPVSVAIKGPSSGGKSFLTEKTLSFFPKSGYHDLSGMSEKALIYDDEPLSHRMLVIYEATGMEGDLQTYFIRSLLSEGRLRYQTVMSTSEGPKPKLIEREGPTGLIVTTTAVHLHQENETRMLTITVTDTREQTAAVMLAAAQELDDEDLDGPYLKPWRALQTWIGYSEHKVTIPYARALASMIPPIAVRLRRDFPMVLSLIRSHAILHQAQREKNGQGKIVATLTDYEKVRWLVGDLVAEGVEGTVPDSVRETVGWVRYLYKKHNEDRGDSEEHKGVTTAQLKDVLHLDRNTTNRRLRASADRGYIKNLEDRKGRPARYAPADPLPEDIVLLPESCDISEKMNEGSGAAHSEGVHPHPPYTDNSLGIEDQGEGGEYTPSELTAPHHRLNGNETLIDSETLNTTETTEKKEEELWERL